MNKRRAAFILAGFLALTTLMVVIVGRPPAFPYEVRQLLRHSPSRFRVSDFDGRTLAWWSAQPDLEYSEFCKEAKLALPNAGWTFSEGSHHVGEQIYEKDGWTLRIWFWYKHADSTARAEEPPEVEISRVARIGDRIAATLQPLFELGG